MPAPRRRAGRVRPTPASTARSWRRRQRRLPRPATGSRSPGSASAVRRRGRARSTSRSGSASGGRRASTRARSRTRVPGAAKWKRKGKVWTVDGCVNSMQPQVPLLRHAEPAPALRPQRRLGEPPADERSAPRAQDPRPARRHALERDPDEHALERRREEEGDLQLERLRPAQHDLQGARHEAALGDPRGAVLGAAEPGRCAAPATTSCVLHPPTTTSSRGSPPRPLPATATRSGSRSGTSRTTRGSGAA